jgi:hypothetical protein
MNLAAQEIAYLDRFCYEVDHFLHGEGSVFQECPGHYQDLGALTNFAPPEIKARWAKSDRQPPARTPFPWQSLEDIPNRLAELESAHGQSGVEAIFVSS